MQGRIYLATALLTLSSVLTGAIGAPPCFNPQNSNNPSFEVIVNAPPPNKNGDVEWRYRPATAAASMDIHALNVSQEIGLKKYWFLWANRCQGSDRGQPCGVNAKGNIVYPRMLATDGNEVRAYFTSVEKANACTMVQAGVALATRESSLKTRATNAGLQVVERSKERQLHVAQRIVDVCLLPEKRLSAEVTGVVLDYEVQDGRSSDQTEQFLIEFAQLIRAAGRQSILYVNPLDAPTQKATGLGVDNIPRIASAFDAIGIMLWHGNKQKNLKASAEAQLRLLKGLNRDKIVLVYEINGTSLGDAQFVHELMLREKYSAVMLWRNSAEVGGSCSSEVNRKLACLVFGRCS